MGKLLLAIGLSLTTVGCAAGGAQSFVGSTSGTQALVAVVIDGNRLLAYVCDGTPGSTPTLAEWLEGIVAPDGTFSIDGMNGVSLSGRVTQGTLTATLTVAGTARAVTAVVATAPAGVFRDDTSFPDTIGGWIVAPSSDQRGAVRQGTMITSPRDALRITGGVAQPITVDGIGTLQPIRVDAI